MYIFYKLKFLTKFIIILISYIYLKIIENKTM